MTLAHLNMMRTILERCRCVRTGEVLRDALGMREQKQKVSFFRALPLPCLVLAWDTHSRVRGLMGPVWSTWVSLTRELLKHLDVQVLQVCVQSKI